MDVTLDTQTPGQSIAGWNYTRRPLWAFCIACFIVQFITTSVIDVAGGEPLPVLLLLGCLFGQCCFAAVLSGLYGDSWIDGLLAGCGLGMVAVLNVGCGALTIEGFTPTRHFFAFLLLVPPVVFAAAGPLILMRQLLRWRLIRLDQPAARYPTSLSNTFATIAVIGALLTALRGFPLLIYGSGTTPADFYLGAASAGVSIFLLALVITISAAYCALAGEDYKMVQFQMAIQAGMWMGVVIVVELILFGVWGVPAASAGNIFFGTVVSTFSAIATLYVGLIALRNSGFRLLTTNDHLKEISERDKADRFRSYQRRTRAQVALVVVVILFVNLLVTRL